MADPQYQQATQAYLAHNREVLPALPESLRAFAGEEDAYGFVSLHDGRIEWWALALPDRSLTLAVFCGDKQIGYRRLTLQYEGRIELVGTNFAQLAAWLDHPETEMLYDEVDVIAQDRFEHRHLLWPAGEFGVRFDRANTISAPVGEEVYGQVLATKGLPFSTPASSICRSGSASLRDTAFALTESPEIAETPVQARELLDALTAIRDAMGLSIAGGLILGSYAILFFDMPLLPVAGVAGAIAVWCLGVVRYFGRQARRRTARFRNPVDGQLRSDVPGESAGARAARRRFMLIACAGYVAALAAIPVVLFM